MAFHGNHTVNEILNRDHGALELLLEDPSCALDELGISGEGPLHMAVYAGDERMVEMLLNRTPRADIKLRNSEGNSPMHVAALLGYAKILRLLYSYSTEEERFRLLLEAINIHGHTALDLANKPVQDWELDLTRMYAVSNDVSTTNTLDKAKAPMIRGRSECSAFLTERMRIDRENKVTNSVGILVNSDVERRKTCAILRGGSTGTDADRQFSSSLEYPRALDENAFRDKDVQFFLNYHKGVEEVVCGVHSRDLAMRTQRTAFRRVEMEERILFAQSEGREVEEEKWHAPPESSGLAWVSSRGLGGEGV